MRIVVFGSTGGIGLEVVKQGLAAGHQITAVARRPEALQIRHNCLRILRGDALDFATVASAIEGQDALISALGIRKDEPTTLYSEGVSNMMKAMQSKGMTRLLCVSASGLNPGIWWQKIASRLFLGTFLKNSFTDLLRMEAAVQASSLDWTIVRPPRLSNHPRTGHYQTAVNYHLGSGSTISRADVADYMLKYLSAEATYQGIVEIAY
jgi:putative NADH-flavin reductase